MKKNIGIVILNYNTKKLTVNSIESIVNKRWIHDYEILIIDNASTDSSVPYIQKRFNKLEIIKNKTNLGFAVANNQGLRYFRKRSKDFVLLLNSDTIVTDNSLDNLVDCAVKNDLAIASSKLLNKDKTFQPNGGDLPTPTSTFIWLSGIDDLFANTPYINSFHQTKEKYYQKSELGWVSGAAMLVRKDMLEEVGYLDDDIFMYSEDVDYCWRAHRAGLKVGWCASSEIIHLGGASSEDPKLSQWLGETKSLKYLYTKYYGYLGLTYFRLISFIFISVRYLIFNLVGKRKEAKIYAKIIRKI